MKLLQFMKEGVPSLGIWTTAGVIDVSAHAGLPRTMLELCRVGDLAALAHLTGPLLPEESLTFAPVVTGMEKMLCVGLNYRAHAKECGMELPKFPAMFNKLPNALAAHKQAIRLPRTGREIDYEAELVFIMGSGNQVFAYTAGNDLSVREWQCATSQWLCGKSYDSFGPIGPYAVTADCLDGGKLHIQSRVNGELRQDSCTDDLIFTPRQIIDYVNERIPLKPGDVVFTGTPSGVMMGYPADQKRWLQPGDVVEVTLEGVGTLRNQLI